MSILSLLSKGLTVLNSVVSIAKDVQDLKKQPKNKIIEEVVNLAVPEAATVIEEVKEFEKLRNKK